MAVSSPHCESWFGSSFLFMLYSVVDKTEGCFAKTEWKNFSCCQFSFFLSEDCTKSLFCSSNDEEHCSQHRSTTKGVAANTAMNLERGFDMLFQKDPLQSTQQMKQQPWTWILHITHCISMQGWRFYGDTGKKVVEAVHAILHTESIHQGFGIRAVLVNKSHRLIRSTSCLAFAFDMWGRPVEYES